MAEPMKQQQYEETTEQSEKAKKKKNPNIFKRGINRVKSDIKYSSKIEEGSPIDGARKLYRAMFPKKN
ncbi:hypothetical protein [Staphylococcus capitis]|uniref:Uncharacterized protein n=1 Tax=Staphylococcus capitis TaxID=29388 RepID=A0ABX1SNV5_STACP|nr:hypothetical protein [Staphylococcus capitis]NMK53986.1 hypothetical protein [Staphylococcus capitis]NMK69321.1 hypothetical protein [Staphylococcus capitis]